MSKTKNVVIDDQNKQNVTNYYQDVNRMTMETLSKLNTAAYHAMKEVQGDRTLSDVVLQSDLYGDLWKVSCVGHDRFVATERRKMEYRNHSLHDLLKELYQRMKMFHHYAVAKGAELPGIKWHIESNGFFAIDLRDCALNMEHSFEDPHAEHHDRQKEGRLFCIGLNLPLLDSEDPESEDSHLWDEYDEFLTFCCEFPDDKECRDIYPCEYSHERAIRDTLAQLDVIKSMNEQNQNK